MQSVFLSQKLCAWTFRVMAMALLWEPVASIQERGSRSRVTSATRRQKNAIFPAAQNSNLQFSGDGKSKSSTWKHELAAILSGWPGWILKFHSRRKLQNYHDDDAAQSDGVRCRRRILKWFTPGRPDTNYTSRRKRKTRWWACCVRPERSRTL